MKRIIKIAFGLWLLMSILSCATSYGVSVACSREAAIQAETEASTLSTWPAVYNSFKRYQGCDDGAIAEGYSEAISQLFAKQWNQLTLLIPLVMQNGEFRAFVLRHVDETVPNDRLKEIDANAKTNCLTSAASFCADLRKAIAQ